MTDISDIRINEMEKTVVHCETKEKFDKLGIILRNSGFKQWYNGWWNVQKEETCIRINKKNNVSYSCIDYYKNEGYTVITFDELIEKYSNKKLNPDNINQQQIYKCYECKDTKKYVGLFEEGPCLSCSNPEKENLPF